MPFPKGFCVETVVASLRLIIRVILRPLSRSSTVHTGSSPYFSLYDTVVSASRRARSLHSLSVWRHNTCPFAICPCGRRRGATSLGLGTKLAPLDQCFTYKLARPPDQMSKNSLDFSPLAELKPISCFISVCTEILVAATSLFRPGSFSRNETHQPYNTSIFSSNLVGT